MLDLTSLLMACSFSAACLAATLLAIWTGTKSEGLLLTSAIGLGLIAFGVGTRAIYVTHPTALVLTLIFAMLLSGLSTIYGGAWQFRHDGTPWRRIGVAGLVSMGIVLPTSLLGYAGLGIILGHAAAAALAILTAHHFWRSREQAPGTAHMLTGLYVILCLSFLPRIVSILVEGGFVLEKDGPNRLDIFITVIGIALIPALGALTLMANQQRIVHRHRQEARTDPLTGLLNRRALFDIYPAELTVPICLVLFDIDRFKSINDTYGHAAGDRIICLFAQSLKENVKPGHAAARLGGEEFVLICPQASVEETLSLTHRIRARFAELALQQQGLTCTASGGVATGAAATSHIDMVLVNADTALYDAKRAGRDRVIVAGGQADIHPFPTTGRAGAA